MKTLCFSLLFALAVSAAHLQAQAATLAPTPTPSASPLPATEPEHAAPKEVCPDCKMDKAKCDDMNKDAAAAAKPGTVGKEEAEKAVIALETQWCEAEAKHDVAFLEKVEADDFTFTDASGKVTGKKEEIAEAKEGGETISFKLSDMKAQVYGDTVVLTGQTTFNVADADGVASAYRWTDIFVRRANGEWQVVASQATLTGQGKAAADTQGE